MERKLFYVVPMERTVDIRLQLQLKSFRLNVRENFLKISIGINDLQSGTFQYQISQILLRTVAEKIDPAIWEG